ncbi:MAG: sigma-70 family RNA polymerase sigma factor [Isosphaeraceae bacterium]
MTMWLESLTRSRRGEAEAAERLLPLVYDELRRLAAHRLASERPGQTLQATALVHEAYLRLVGESDPGWNGRGHFFGAAAEAMRRILVDNARKKGRLKRGGGHQQVELDDIEVPNAGADCDLLALDEALGRLEAIDKPKADLVKLRYFTGLSIEEVANALGISRATAARHWHFAKVWLFSELRGADGDQPVRGN